MPSFPASYPLDNIISVAATDRSDQLAGFSNFGVTSVDIGAPGTAIHSTEPGNATGIRWGTSMAAPHVSAAAALLWSVDPHATVAEVRDKIFSSADSIASLSGRIATGGRLNLFDALEGWQREQIRSHFYIPPKVGGGDADFFGHGPEIEIAVQLRVNPANKSELQSRVQMHAVETGPDSDGTQVDGPADPNTGWETAYVAPDGQVIDEILSSMTSGIGYLDTSHEGDIVRMPAGDLVRHFEIVGDTNGDEAGSKTGVRVHFRPVEMKLSEPPPVVGVPCRVPMNVHEFAPKLARPDDDFDGNGPQIDTYVQLRRSDGNVESRVYMHAAEWDAENSRPHHDFTTFDGWSTWQTAYEATPGNRVLRILSPMQAHRDYIDLDFADDILTGGDLVQTYRFVGDQDGGPFGGTDAPSVEVHFNDLFVELESSCGGASVPLRSHFLVPPLVNGDAEFGGNGPDVNVVSYVRVSEDQKTLETLVRMSARETSSPLDTLARYDGEDWETAYTAPDGRFITPFPMKTSTFSYTDTDHEADVFTMPVGDLVSFYEFIGDADGADAGVRTSVRVVFNPMAVNLTPSPVVDAANVVELTPTADLLFEPSLSRGDTDFDGNGPLVNTYVQLRVSGGAVEARAYMLAQEWSSDADRPRADFTAFDGWSGWQEIARAPTGRNIARLLSPIQSHRSYVDTDHAIDTLSGDDLVREFVFVGADGGVLGAADRPGVRVVFSDLRVELT